MEARPEEHQKVGKETEEEMEMAHGPHGLNMASDMENKERDFNHLFPIFSTTWAGHAPFSMSFPISSVFFTGPASHVVDRPFHHNQGNIQRLLVSKVLF